MKHKRLLLVILSLATAICMIFGLTACGDDSEKDTKDDGNTEIVNPGGDEQGNTPSGNPQTGGEQGGTQGGEQDDEEPATEGLAYTEIYSDDGTTVIGYSVGAGEAYDEEEIIIPSKHNGLPVISVSLSEEAAKEYMGSGPAASQEEFLEIMHAYTFAYCDYLTSITIPNSVTSIGTRAFEFCIALTSITIPDSVTEIRGSAFSNCVSLTNITLPDSVTTIGDYAFHDCESLTNITLPDSVTTIGDNAFYYCESLTHITLPNSVTRIGNEAFGSSSSLTEIHYNGTQAQWENIEKATNWNLRSAIQKVICTDGTIELEL